jgi:transglutaminase-like putative cysteine protease
MKYRLWHETRYHYARPVTVASHLHHLLPWHGGWQRVIKKTLTATPEPHYSAAMTDCFGNGAGYFLFDTPHAQFTVTLEAEIDVFGQTLPAPENTPAWEKVRRTAQTPPGYQAQEFIYPSPMIAPFAAITDYMAASFPPGRPILQGLHDAVLRMRKDFAFRAGVTEIGTPLTEVFAHKAGVCQDFSHLMIAGLRGLGLPARYASGYIRTRPPPGGTKRRGADQSHAWVSAWLGMDGACNDIWADLDPTNGLIVADEHVLLGYGRDFSDVSPLSGVILGGGKHNVRVAVDLEPVESGV